MGLDSVAMTTVPFPDPGSRPPAPEPLRKVQAFVNTRDIENVRDELETPAGLQAALTRIGLIEADARPLRERDRLAAVRMREALRSLLLGNNGGTVEPEALAELEGVAGRARFTVSFETVAFSDGQARLVPTAGGIDGVLGRLVAIVQGAMLDGSFGRLKACRRDVCHWAYYDRSRNGSSTWCATSVCGNRVNTRTYRQRHAAHPAPRA